jgi:sulfate permease, SulP family
MTAGQEPAQPSRPQADAPDPVKDWRRRLTPITVPAAFQGGKWRSPADILAGLTTSISQIPDAMASAVLVGVSPAYALNAIIVATPVAALFASCEMMSVVTTSAMAVAAGEVLAGKTGDDRVEALVLLTLLVGAFQLILGILRLGFLTRFISNAIMTGFLTGIGVNIILGQLGDLTGFSSDRHKNIGKAADLLGHLGDIDVRTTIVGLGKIALLLAFNRGRVVKVSRPSSPSPSPRWRSNSSVGRRWR